MKKSELQRIINEEIRKVLKEGSGLQRTVSKLYDKVLDTPSDDKAVEAEMEKIVKTVGYTSAQKAKKGSRKFTLPPTSRIIMAPEFETLTDEQLKAIKPFLQAIIDRANANALETSSGTLFRQVSGFDKGESWNGTKIK